MITVSPTFGLVLPHLTDMGAAELAKGAAELAKGAAELANFGVGALNTSVAKGFIVVALIAVTAWGVKSILHELRDTTVKHDLNHRGTPPPPPSTTA